MSTASEIAQAITALPKSERDKLAQIIPQLLPELVSDVEWEGIIQDERPRPGLTALLDETEKVFRANPGAFPELKETDFSSS